MNDVALAWMGERPQNGLLPLGWPARAWPGDGGRARLKLITLAYPRVRKQLLDAVEVWTKNGWLERVDIGAMLERI